MWNSAQFLQGHFLVASPHLQDPNFARSVVYLCDHNEEGAMGLIVNRPLSTVAFSDILKELHIPISSQQEEVPIYFGGPVEPGRGFVLHSPDYVLEESIVITESVSLTSHPRILGDMANGLGPGKSLFTLGYAGWAPGQLEQELIADDWITLPADDISLFETTDSEKWYHLYYLLGMDPFRMPGTHGSA